MNDDRYEWLRELSIVLLSLTLVSVGLVMAWHVFEAAGKVGKDKDEEDHIIAAYNRQKDTMEVTGMVFITTVLGYYFGRVPAAKAAADAKKETALAKKETTDAKQEAANAKQQAAGLKSSLDQTHGILSRTRALFTESPKTGDDAHAAIEKARSILGE